MSKELTPEQLLRRRERRKARRLAKKQARTLSSNSCRECGRPLSDPESRQRGFGPSCWAKVTKGKGVHYSFPEAEKALREIPGDKALCLCGMDLHLEPVKGYPHPPGAETSEGPMWLYVVCPNCHKEVSLWKLGISPESCCPQEIEEEEEIKEEEAPEQEKDAELEKKEATQERERIVQELMSQVPL